VPAPRALRRHPSRLLAGAALAGAALAAVLALAGCSIVPQRPAPPPPPADTPSNDRDLAAAVLMANTFQTMLRLTQAAPAEQAEIVSAARDAYQDSPRGETQLRYALLLATPGHPARDVKTAQMLLRELAAQPEELVPIERAVVLVELAQLDRESDLQADNQELQSSALRTDEERSAADQRRLQAETEENVRLRRELETAQAKLDAIATIERNLTERRAGAAGSGPGTGTAAAGAGGGRTGAGAGGGGSGSAAAAPSRAARDTVSGPVTRAGSASGAGGGGGNFEGSAVDAEGTGSGNAGR